MHTDYEAYGDYILVHQSKPPETTESGLVVPKSAFTTPIECEVLSVGDGVKNIEVGDWIIFKPVDIFLGANVTVQEKAVFLEKNGEVVAFRKEAVVSIRKAINKNDF